MLGFNPLGGFSLFDWETQPPRPNIDPQTADGAVALNPSLFELVPLSVPPAWVFVVMQTESHLHNDDDAAAASLLFLGEMFHMASVSHTGVPLFLTAALLPLAACHP